MTPLREISFNATSITIEWDQPHCTAPVSHLLVIYRPQGCCLARSATLAVTETEFMASSLVPNTLYEFEVSLADEVGYWSKSSVNSRTASLPKLKGMPYYHIHGIVFWEP